MDGTDLRSSTSTVSPFPANCRRGPSRPAALLSHGVDLAGHDVTLNSRPSAGEFDSALTAKGIIFGSLDRLLVERADVLRPYFDKKVINPASDKFAALHAAAWSGGSVLFVPRGAQLEKPVHILNGLAGGVDLGKTLIILEEGAEATVLSETAGGDGDPGLHCGAIEIFVGRGALRYVNLQNWGSGVWHFAHQKALVDRDGRLQWTIGASAAGWPR